MNALFETIFFRIAKSGPRRPPITVEGGHSHGDCGQQVMAA
jgi:hypothetical protein